MPVREFSRLVLDENDVGREELEELAHVKIAHLLLGHLVDAGRHERHEWHGERAN